MYRVLWIAFFAALKSFSYSSSNFTDSQILHTTTQDSAQCTLLLFNVFFLQVYSEKELQKEMDLVLMHMSNKDQDQWLKRLGSLKTLQVSRTNYFSILP